MSGSSLQIFSIMMLCMAFWTPLQANPDPFFAARLFFDMLFTATQGIMNVQKTFARYDDSNGLQKLE